MTLTASDRTSDGKLVPDLGQGLLGVGCDEDALPLGQHVADESRRGVRLPRAWWPLHEGEWARVCASDDVPLAAVEREGCEVLLPAKDDPAVVCGFVAVRGPRREGGVNDGRQAGRQRLVGLQGSRDGFQRIGESSVAPATLDDEGAQGNRAAGLGEKGVVVNPPGVSHPRVGEGANRVDDLLERHERCWRRLELRQGGI